MEIYYAIGTILYARGQQFVFPKWPNSKDFRHFKLYGLRSNYSTLPLWHEGSVRKETVPFSFDYQSG